MRTLPLTASDDDIRQLVVEWSELLAAKRYQEALALLPPSDEFPWTAEIVDQVIRGYGARAVADPETTMRLLAHHGVSQFEITPLAGRPDREAIIAKIDVNRKDVVGLDQKGFLGMVHYDDVPLNGFRSDLTAIFDIKRIGADRLTLEFVDLHVM